MAEKKSNKINFEVGNKEYSLLRPKSKHNEAASMEYNRVFSNYFNNRKRKALG